MITYNKLVRDRIPEIIEENQKVCEIQILSDEEYIKSLNTKLKEEFDEYVADESVSELADMVEVIYAILDHTGISIEEFEKVRKEKKAKNGGFEKKLFLVSVSE